MKTDDALWKAILEDIFDDFLLFFFEKEASLFDLDKGFVFLDKELEQIFPTEGSTPSQKFVDKLVKVFTRSGGEEWVLVHVEVQGYNDPEFAKRMFTYFYRILDTYNKPITSIVIFTDGNKNYHPRQYTYNFLGANLVYQFNTYKIIDQDEKHLAESNNPFALVVLTVLLALKKGKITEDELFYLKVELARKLLQKKILKRKIRALMNFLRFYISFENQQITYKFEEQISIITNNTATMGIEEFLLQRAEKQGIEKGIEKGIEIGKEDEANAKNTAFAKKLMRETDFSAERIADLVGVPVSFIINLRKSL